MTQIAAAPQRRNLALWSLALLGVGLLSLLPLSLIDTPLHSSSSGAGLFDRTRIAYFEFDLHADTLWLADPKAPDQRRKLFSVNHAPEYGIIPSLSPDSRSVAYTVLPPDMAAPGPDAPAELWVASLSGGQPVRIATDADLLVPAVWAPDGASLIYRKTNDNDHSELVLVPADGSRPGRWQHVSRDPLFPVAVVPATDPAIGDVVYYVEINEHGSNLLWLGLRSSGNTVANLSPGLTRDWTLSPDGKQLAYLEMTLNGQEAAARAYVLNLATGSRVAVGDPSSDAFSPAWDSDGRLVIGQLRAGARSTAATLIYGNGTERLAAPQRGFDVPLAVDATAGAAVTSFDGNSIVNPGRSTLVVVEPSGGRREIASGEVTFLGWITP